MAIHEAHKYRNRNEYSSPPSLQLVHPTLEDLAWHLANIVIPNHQAGFTFSARTWRRPDIDPEVYIVALKLHEQPLDHLPCEAELNDWLVQTKQLLYEPNHFIGWWWHREGDLYYLDVSRTVRGLSAAMAFAHDQEQKEIYHPATNESIPVHDMAEPNRVLRVA